MVINVLTELRRRIREHSENFNKEMGKISANQLEVTELKKKITLKLE